MSTTTTTTTTVINFNPDNSASPPFSTLVTLDGATYVLTATWNLFGQRWYINIYDTNQNLVLCQALTGSPYGFDLNLAFGSFNDQLVFRAPAGSFEVGGTPNDTLTFTTTPAIPGPGPVVGDFSPLDFSSADFFTGVTP